MGTPFGASDHLDIPNVEYKNIALSRPEWREAKVMAGIGCIMWICGKDVASDARVHAFMKEFSNLEHVVSSPDYCPNNIAFDAAAAANIRLGRVDPSRFEIPIHDSESSVDTQKYGGSSAFHTNRTERPLPPGVHVAARGHILELMPAVEIKTDQAVPSLEVENIIEKMPEGVLEEAAQAQAAAQVIDEPTAAWIDSLPPGAGDAEIQISDAPESRESLKSNKETQLIRSSSNNGSEVANPSDCCHHDLHSASNPCNDKQSPVVKESRHCADLGDEFIHCVLNTEDPRRFDEVPQAPAGPYHIWQLK